MINLKAIRIKKGFTQQEVAQAIGTSEAHYNKIERGVHVPKFKFAHRLATLFKITLDQLYQK